MNLIEHNLNTGERIVSISKEEYEFLECFNKLSIVNPNETLILCNPKTYGGFNLANGKEIRLMFEEIKK